MKRSLFLLAFLAMFSSAFAQKTYTIDNETLELKSEVEGKLDLLWNTFDGKFRYFVRTEDGTITELKNTRGSDKKYQEEYKRVLNQLTNMDSDDVNLTLSGLVRYLDEYNASENSDYQKTEKAKLQARIGIFGGLTNHPFVDNPDNKSAPLIGMEFEILEANKLPRHAGFFSVRHAFEQDEFKYSETQLALGYRFRFINQTAFNIYANLKLATFTFAESPEVSTSALDAPFIFGLGSDIKVRKNGFITLAYNELFAIFMENEGNFPIDFAIGYKLNL